MKALLIVDMLNDFVKDWGTLKVEGAKEIIPYIKGFKATFKKKGFPVIYVCDSHTENDREFELWPPHCIKGTKGAEIVNDLKPDVDDYIVDKTTYSGFHNTRLDALLKELSVNTLYITGVAMNICVQYTAADARMNGYNVIVPIMGVKGLKKEDEEYMKKQFLNILKIKLI
ncbi:MAG: isochorismatase family protein [Nitrospiraceae bacterium]|nr:isochorismatase family protein [Nitrospiraceae bacterium]